MKLHPMVSYHIGTNPCFCGSSIFQYNGLSLTSVILLLLLLSTSTTHSVRAQSVPPNGSQDDPYYNKFSPSMGVIIIILISTLFFIYIRHCSEDSSTAAEARNPVSAARSRRNQGGLDQTVIESFPTFNYSAVRSLHIGNGASECAVCLDEFEDDETLRLISNCDHVFHPECIDDWLVAHATCPLCRANLVPQPGESIHALELGRISEHNSDQDGVAVDAPDRQYGSHHQSMNNNVDEESVEHPLHAPPPQPEMADFSTTLPYASWPVEGRPPGTAAQGLLFPTAFDLGIFYNTSYQPGFGDRVGEGSGWGERFTPRLDGYAAGRPVQGWPPDTAAQGLRFPTVFDLGTFYNTPYQPGFGGGVGEGSGWGERYAGMPAQSWPSDTTTQGLRFPTVFDLGIFYNTPYQPGFGAGVGEGCGWGERYAGMPAQSWPSDTAGQGLRFPTAFDLGIFYNTPYQRGFGAGVGEGSGWGKRRLDGYANRPAQRWPPNIATQGLRFPRACHLGTVYNKSNRPCFGGGVGEGNGRGGGQLNGYDNRSAQSRSTSTAAQSFLSRRAFDFETSRRTRCQASFDGGVGKGSSRSTGIVSKDSDSEISYGSSTTRRTKTKYRSK